MDGLPYYIYFQIYIIKFYIKIDLQKFTEKYCSRDFSSYLRVQLLMVLRSFDTLPFWFECSVLRLPDPKKI